MTGTWSESHQAAAPTERAATGADRVGHGEASLGDAQAEDPRDDPEMIEPDAPPLDADTEAEDDPAPAPAPRGNDDPAPNVP